MCVNLILNENKGFNPISIMHPFDYMILELKLKVKVIKGI